MQLDIEVESAGIRVTKHYVIHPDTAVVRQWLTLKNASDLPVHINQVEFLHSYIDSSLAPDLQFNYLTGGGNYNGSQLLKTESVGPAYQRALDSNEGIQAGNYSSFLPLVFLLDQSANEGLAVGWDYLGHWRFEIDQVWPAQGWQEVSPDYDIPTECEITKVRVAAGDKIRFILKHNGENSPDPIMWDPKIVIHEEEPASSR
jgi:hypothetical protein